MELPMIDKPLPDLYLNERIHWIGSDNGNAN